MEMKWLLNGFIDKRLYAPFIIDTDDEYYSDLSKRLNLVLTCAKKAGADNESINIIRKYKNKIEEAVKCYYRADIAKCNTIIQNLLKNTNEDPLAVNALSFSGAFPGEPDQEIQFFRSRTGNPSKAFAVKDMIGLPRKNRSQTGNYRFSIPGNPSMYLSNTSYGCWIETGYPAEIDFNVSPVVVKQDQKIFNLAVEIRDGSLLNELEENRVHTWLKLLMLMIATSYRVKEEGRTFKSEYIISQSIMMGCKKLGYDGVAYYSKRVEDEVFARCAINIALFINYDKNNDYSAILNYMKMDDSFNYSIYKNLLPSLKYKTYYLRATQTGFITNIGNYEKQFPYKETDFYNFDQFLFATWRDKPNGKGKDDIPWGINITSL